jgi:hypothetical protein
MNRDTATPPISHLLSNMPSKALRQFERQLKTLTSWNMTSVVKAIVRA